MKEEYNYTLTVPLQDIEEAKVTAGRGPGE